MVDHKKIANILPTGAILFFIVIVMAYIFMPEPQKKFILSQNETLHTIVHEIKPIQPEEIKTILDKNDQKYQFIDLRTPKEFNLHHLPGAVNVPVHELLNENNEAILNPKDKINILYGATVEEACAPWLILKQLNYQNNTIMLGGYNLVKSNIIDKYAPDEVWFKNEVAQYDFAEIVKGTAGGADNSASGSTKSIGTTIKKKPKKGTAGGC